MIGEGIKRVGTWVARVRASCVRARIEITRTSPALRFSFFSFFARRRSSSSQSRFKMFWFFGSPIVFAFSHISRARRSVCGSVHTWRISDLSSTEREGARESVHGERTSGSIFLIFPEYT